MTTRNPDPRPADRGRFGRRAAAALLLAFVGAASAMAQAQASVGFQELTVPDGDAPALDVGVWYPSDAPAAVQRLGFDQQTVARGGAVLGQGLPLVVMSHGTGGWFAGHADTARALAEAGFVVAAVTHTGDNYRDSSRQLQIEGRAHHVMRLLDFMLADWPDHARIAPGRVGAFGFSAGGFTVLVLVGGMPDPTRVAPHCAAHPEEWACRLVHDHAAELPAQAPPASAWLHDQRIRAAVIASPALGYTFGRDGLAGVTVPIQLWRGTLDEILPQPFHAQAVADALPVPPEYHVVENAGHFSFLAPCGPQMAATLPELCRDAPGFDRVAFHAAFNAEVVRFFARTLAARPD